LHVDSVGRRAQAGLRRSALPLGRGAFGGPESELSEFHHRHWMIAIGNHWLA
jgi:hypothetical protein